MSEDDTQETYSRESTFLQRLTRKIALFLGVALILWIIVIKYAPQLVSPQVGPIPPKFDPEKRDELLAQKRQEWEATQNRRPELQDREAPAASFNAKLSEQIADLESRLKQYEHKEPQSPAPAAPQGMSEADRQHVKQLEEQIALQQAALADMKTQFSQRNTQLEEQVKQQQEMIATLKGQVETLKAHGTRRLAAITAFGFMKEALQRGEPFALPLQQLGQQVEDPQAKALVAQLAPYADKGVVTLPALKNAFGAALTKALSETQKDNTLVKNLKSLIRIRKVGEQQAGTDDESVLARAEAKIERGEIGASLHEIATLSPPAADAFNTWVKDAETLLQVRKLAEALQLAIAHGQDMAEAAAPASETVPEIMVEEMVIPAPDADTPPIESPQEALQGIEPQPDDAQATVPTEESPPIATHELRVPPAKPQPEPAAGEAPPDATQAEPSVSE